MAAATSNYRINKLITKKFNLYFLKKYLKKHNLKLKSYRYKETLYTLPFFMFVCDSLWIKDHKKTVEIFAIANIAEPFYDFFFDAKTQETIYETNGRHFQLDEFEDIIKNLFLPIAQQLSSKVFADLKEINHFPNEETLTNFFTILLSYFYTDDIIQDFGPDINKLIADNEQYEKRVKLFTLKLEYLKQIQNMIKDLDPTHANFMLVAINVISKDHKG